MGIIRPVTLLPFMYWHSQVYKLSPLKGMNRSSPSTLRVALATSSRDADETVQLYVLHKRTQKVRAREADNIAIEQCLKQEDHPFSI
jgi:hypothetical protein